MSENDATEEKVVWYVRVQRKLALIVTVISLCGALISGIAYVLDIIWTYDQKIEKLSTRMTSIDNNVQSLHISLLEGELVEIREVLRQIDPSSLVYLDYKQRELAITRELNRLQNG